MELENRLFLIIIDLAVGFSGLFCIAIGLTIFPFGNAVSVAVIIIGVGGSFCSISIATRANHS